jgi:hypothetical protein
MIAGFDFHRHDGIGGGLNVQRRGYQGAVVTVGINTKSKRHHYVAAGADFQIAFSRDETGKVSACHI